ncbi:MAG: FeoB-associated Cys-rich membrane protein [Breznakibacter sp.]
MVQEILTYLIVAFAFGYTIWNTIMLFGSKRKSSCAGGCGGACSAKNTLMKEVGKGTKPYLIDKFGF